MALIKCGKCGSEVEAISAGCPKCGEPVAAAAFSGSPQKKKLGRTWIWILGAAVVVALVGAWLVQRSAGGAPQPTTSTAQPTVKVDVDSLKTRAEAGEAEAQRILGTLYTKGQQVPQSYVEAAKWFRKAADQGNPAAQVALGELHEAGQGVPIDDAASVKLYRQAADQGYAPGQYNLAVLYVMGKGVPQNQTEAVKWYRLAADQGDALAQYNLGMRYYEAKGVAPDPVQAYQWLGLAAAQGIEDAVKAQNNLKSRMTREQIAEAQRRVAAFNPKKTVVPAR
jgi:TPR repeat protein